MSTTKVTAPAGASLPESFNTNFGGRTLVFENGVAQVSDLSDGLRAYLVSAGYGVGDTDVQEPEAPEPADPREVGQVDVSTKLRDAAVDPDFDVDFLPPTNAGEANPHGPDVVSPGIHAVQGPGPIVPGTVGSPDYQQAKETAAAEAVLAGDASVPEATQEFGKVAALEYDRTKAEGPEAGLAQEVSGSDLTDEERDLLGLGDEVPDHMLKGEALDAKLEELGLSTDGKADEKRARIRIANTPADELAGADLQTALQEAGLPRTGSADERRARVQEFRDGQDA